MLDGALGDSESLAGLSEELRAGEEADLFGDDLYVDIDQASEVTCSSPECSSVVDSISTSCGNWGHLLNLSDQLRRKFSTT